LPFLLPETDMAKQPQWLAVGGYDGAIVLYSAETGALQQTLEGPTDVECLAFHPKGGTVLLAGSAADGTLWMYHVPNANTNKVMQVFVGHESAVTACDFTPDGKFALSTSSDGTCRLWAPRTGACKHVFRFNDTHTFHGNVAGLTSMVTHATTTPDGKQQTLVLVGAEDGRAHVCHTGTKKVIATLTHYDITTAANNNDNGNDEDEEMELPMSVEAVGFCSAPNYNHWCATAGVDGVLKIWDLQNNATCRQVCRRQTQQQQQQQDNNNNNNNNNSAPESQQPQEDVAGGITRLQWHPTLPLCFTSTTQGTIDLWDARNGQLLQSFTGHKNVLNDMNVQYLEQNAMTAIITTCSDDETVRVYKVNIASIWNQ